MHFLKDIIFDFTRAIREFHRRWASYLLLMLLPSLILVHVIMPFFNLLGTWILSLFSIPFISNVTFLEMLRQPLCILCLVGLLYLLILTAFFEFTIILVGIQEISRDNDNWLDILLRSLHILLRRGFKSSLTLPIYFLLIMPFGGLIYRSEVFTKLQIPQFVEEWIFEHWLVVPLIIFYIWVIWLALKRMYMLPLVILQDMSTREAFHESKERTQGHLIPLFIRILITGTLSVAVASGVYFGLYFLQIYMDRLPNVIATAAGIFNMSLIQLFGLFFSLWVSVIMLLIILPEDCVDLTPGTDHSYADFSDYEDFLGNVDQAEEILSRETDESIEVTAAEATGEAIEGTSAEATDEAIKVTAAEATGEAPNKSSEESIDKTTDKSYNIRDLLTKNRRRGRTPLVRHVTTALVSIYVVSVVIYSAFYLLRIDMDHTMVISHRGVDGNNGVQNTIPALRKTIDSAHPDMIEIDIQETKDKKFVVMHDSNLKSLCGINASPQQLTLKELTKLKAKEHGKSAYVASFDEYLKVSNGKKQRLLIEMKTSSMDSSDMLERFVKKYASNLKKNGHWIQTQDYMALNQIKRLDPDLKTACILPLNLIYPSTSDDGYTMEITGINDPFISRAGHRNQEVYAWTVNNTDEMNELLFMNVSGIITDYPSRLNTVEDAFENDPNYADRLYLYVNGSRKLQNLMKKITYLGNSYK